MKKFQLFVAAGLMLSVACNNKTPDKNTSKDTAAVKVSIPGAAETGSDRTVNMLVDNYLELKIALTNDNAKMAGNAAERMNKILNGLDNSSYSADQKKVIDGLKGDLKEHTEHINGSSSDIAHQREHFALLSADMIELVNAFGANQTLYKTFCPMYDDKKGAYWLSETKDVKNPYYGKEMLTCGEVKDEIKARQ